jgi:hypothetical protein
MTLSFAAAVVSIREQPVDQLWRFAERCREQEGLLRTPLVLLQLIALSRQYESTQAAAAAAATAAASDDAKQARAHSRGLRAHGSQTRCTLSRASFPHPRSFVKLSVGVALCFS